MLSVRKIYNPSGVRPKLMALLDPKVVQVDQTMLPSVEEILATKCFEPDWVNKATYAFKLESISKPRTKSVP